MEKGSLTQRQLEVLELIRIGLSNKEIARQLSISEATVKAHVTVVLKSHGVSSRTKLLASGTD
jgi:DNA-binding NarL/FixJ family response regulator